MAPGPDEHTQEPGQQVGSPLGMWVGWVAAACAEPKQRRTTTPAPQLHIGSGGNPGPYWVSRVGPSRVDERRLQPVDTTAEIQLEQVDSLENLTDIGGRRAVLTAHFAHALSVHQANNARKGLNPPNTPRGLEPDR